MHHRLEEVQVCLQRKSTYRVCGMDVIIKMRQSSIRHAVCPRESSWIRNSRPFAHYTRDTKRALSRSTSSTSSSRKFDRSARRSLASIDASWVGSRAKRRRDTKFTKSGVGRFTLVLAEKITCDTRRKRGEEAKRKVQSGQASQRIKVWRQAVCSSLGRGWLRSLRTFW